MLLRLLFLIAMMGYTGPDARSTEERKPTGGAFGTIVGLFTALGAVVLAVLIVLAILVITGQFDADLWDPLV